MHGSHQEEHSEQRRQKKYTNPSKLKNQISVKIRKKYDRFANEILPKLFMAIHNILTV